MPPELYASTGHASAKKRNKIPRAANLGEDADAQRSFGDGDAMRVSVTWEKVDARAHLPVGADPLDSDTFVPADARADRPRGSPRARHIHSCSEEAVIHAGEAAADCTIKPWAASYG